MTKSIRVYSNGSKLEYLNLNLTAEVIDSNDSKNITDYPRAEKLERN